MEIFHIATLADWSKATKTGRYSTSTLGRTLKQEGDTGAGRLLGAVRGKGEATRQLAYRLYTLCERQGWAEDARAYNELITSWSGIEAAVNREETGAKQGRLFE